MKEDLALRFESILGTLYLLVENWHCDNILKQIRGDYDRKECKKYRKYLNIAYEYLFRVFIKVADPKLSEQMPAVAPQFQYNTLIDWAIPSTVGNTKLCNTSPFECRELPVWQLTKCDRAVAQRTNCVPFTECYC
uniref:RNase III domain-containing protein n=1 Tax=Globodera pallida TaxID=36090 RepID=A0A183BIZ7_GLOPA